MDGLKSNGSTYSSNEASLLGSLAPSYIFSYMICPNSRILMLLSNLGFLLFIWRVVWLVNLSLLSSYSSATDGRADLKSNLTCEFYSSTTLQQWMVWRVVWLWISVSNLSVLSSILLFSLTLWIEFHLVLFFSYSSAVGGRPDLKSNLTCEFQCLIFLATLQPQMIGRIWRVVWLWIHLVVLAGYSSAADGRTDLKSSLTCKFQCLPRFSSDRLPEK